MSPDKTNISLIPTHDRAAAVAAARGWLGVKWLHQGRNRFGIDCAGLLIKVHQELGLPVADRQGYKRTPDTHAFLTHIRQQTTHCEVPQPGSIAVFRQALFPCHTAIFAEQHGVLTIVHAYAGSGKVVEEPFINEWPDLLVEARDFIGLID